MNAGLQGIGTVENIKMPAKELRHEEIEVYHGTSHIFLENAETGAPVQEVIRKMGLWSGLFTAGKNL
jgi:hypothetical protein